jgi:hypothetical protein
MEYPCHAPGQPRWFLLQATPLPPPVRAWSSPTWILRPGSRPMSSCGRPCGRRTSYCGRSPTG